MNLFSAAGRRERVPLFPLQTVLFPGSILPLRIFEARYMDMAKRSKGNTANSMMALLETRLDNVLRRLGVGRTIWATRQIVAHGHVLVDGRKTDIASYLVKPGQTITFREKIHKVLRDNMEQNPGHQVPGWLEWNPAQLTGKVLATPTPEDVPFEVNMNLIIEFYR